MVALLLAACQIGDGEMGKTKTGKLIFNGWGKDMQDLFSGIVSPAFKFNQYIIASEEDKENVFNQNFSASLHIISASQWMIKDLWNGAEIHFEMEEGESLESAGSVMRIINMSEWSPATIQGRVFKLSNMGNGLWMLSEGSDILLSLQFESAATPASLSNTNFTVSGRGEFTHETNYCSSSSCETIFTFLSFDILSPMGVKDVADGNWSVGSLISPLFWEKGHILLSATNPDGQGNAVEALILDDGRVSIGIGGVTQEWNQ